MESSLQLSDQSSGETTASAQDTSNQLALQLSSLSLCERAPPQQQVVDLMRDLGSWRSATAEVRGTINELHEDHIRQHYPDIVQTQDCYALMDYLWQDGVISSEQVGMVKNKVTREASMRELLDICGRSERGYYGLVRAMCLVKQDLANQTDLGISVSEERESYFLEPLPVLPIKLKVTDVTRVESSQELTACSNNNIVSKTSPQPDTVDTVNGQSNPGDDNQIKLQIHRNIRQAALNLSRQMLERTMNTLSLEEAEKTIEILRKCEIVIGSVLLLMTVSSMGELEDVWRLYTRGSLHRMLYNALVTEELLVRHRLQDLVMKVKVEKEAYLWCKEQLAERARQAQDLVLEDLEAIIEKHKALSLDHIVLNILSHLDSESLLSAELVCHHWYKVITDGKLWRKLMFHKVSSDYQWRGLADRRDWGRYFLPVEQHFDDRFYKSLYMEGIRRKENNWRRGRHILQRIKCEGSADMQTSNGVYCVQFDDQRIVSSHRDSLIRVWDLETLECSLELKGHEASALCMQFDNNIIISGSTDKTIRVWNIHTGELLNTLKNHSEPVLHIKFKHSRIVSSSKDRGIGIWDMHSPREITLIHMIQGESMKGHRAAVNVVDFDLKYIVSGSGDRTAKVWDANTFEHVRTLTGHGRGIACLQYLGKLLVTGSADKTARLWDIESGTCLRVLEGHNDLVRCIYFNNKRIVSGCYDREIKIWDMKAALDPLSIEDSICLCTLNKQEGRVLSLKCDDFKIVSSSTDGTILIWDFLNAPVVDDIRSPSTASQTLPTYDLT